MAEARAWNRFTRECEEGIACSYRPPRREPVDEIHPIFKAPYKKHLLTTVIP